METTILDRVFELDLQTQGIQRSNVEINQGNINSFRFIFKLRDGAVDIPYTNFSSATIILSQNGFTIYHSPIDSTLQHIPEPEAFGRTGIITGQLDLSFTDGTLSTLYFNFKVVPSLARLPEGQKEVFVNQIQQIIDKGNQLIEELRGNSFVTNDQLDTRLTEYAQLSGANFTGPLKRLGNTVWDSGNLLIEREMWTPTIYGSVSVGSYDIVGVHGDHVRTGRTVTCSCFLAINNITGMEGYVSLGGLPFVIADYRAGATIAYMSGIRRGTAQITLVGSRGENRFVFHRTPESGATEPLDATALNISMYIMISATYIIA